MLLDEIQTRSPSFAEVLRIVRRVAQTDASILIAGETGSGKDFIAELIHDASPRRSRPLLKIDCASIPASLAESELFGYEKGAFSDASEPKVGKLQIANGSTLYFDGINHLPATVQSKLLRFVQERVVEPLGSTQSVHVDCRIIASCSLPLKICLKEEQLREDLYYRLSAATIEIPALREREQDVESIAISALSQFNEKYRKNSEFTSEALQFLRSYHWPGNIRELMNVVEHAVIHAGESIAPSDLILSDVVSHPQFLSHAADRQMSLEDLEKLYIAEVLRKTRGHLGNAAEILKVNRKTLLMKRRKYGLE
ncbi:MAG: hypothetical protein C5B54_09655 [Acidobacteria bacterium]|nr:MAG: hypothetical protein C5B54_09655 [Acidobacteriota bacterium]